MKIDNSWEKGYSEDIRQRVRALIKDSRMVENKQILTTENLRIFAMVYKHSIEMGDWGWGKKTQRERGEWIKKFNKAINDFRQLAEDGPVPFQSWGFPLKDYLLLEVLEKLGHQPQQTESPLVAFKYMHDCTKKAESTHITLVDILFNYENQVRGDADAPQELKKPADAKAQRARFIINMKSRDFLTNTQIALIASILFNDESIDDRLVRRLSPR